MEVRVLGVGTSIHCGAIGSAKVCWVGIACVGVRDVGVKGVRGGDAEGVRMLQRAGICVCVMVGKVRLFVFAMSVADCMQVRWIDHFE